MGSAASGPHLSCCWACCPSFFACCSFVNHLDEVPELPPFDSYVQVPHGMWLRDDLVLLQVRWSCVTASQSRLQ